MFNLNNQDTKTKDDDYSLIERFEQALDYNAMTPEFWTITPHLAKRMLVGNVNNRNVSISTVAGYARDMGAGKWRVNGDAIRFTTGGRLLDGQHRLLSCIESGSAFNTLVIFGVPADIFATIDNGKKRTAGDILSIANIPYGNTVAASVRWVAGITSDNPLAASSRDVTKEEVLAFCKDNPRIIELTAQFGTKLKNGIISQSLAVALLFLFEKNHPTQEAMDFFTDLYVGAGLDATDPVLVLRNRLTALSKASDRRTRVSTIEIAAMIIRAWNARINGGTRRIARGSIRNKTTGEIIFPTIE